jgi:PAS domain S-box-containing protein
MRIKGVLYGRDLFLSYRKIAGTPYVINVAFDAEQVLAPWYRLVALYGLLGIVLLAAVAVSVRFVRKDQTRTALLTASRQRQAIIDGMSARIALLDADGRIIEANRALLESAGLGRIDVVGRRLWETFWFSHSADSQRRVRSAIARAATGESTRADFTVRVGQSVFAAMDTTFQPVEDTTAGERWIVASGVDVTERRQRESQLAQSQKLEAIGLVAGGVAHDFNNLLGAISNFAGFLVQDLRDRKPQHSFAVRIAEACEIGKQVVTQLLAYARPAPKARKEIDLRTVLRQVETVIGALLPPSATLTCDLPSGAVKLLADQSQLTQIFLNLALNARDAIEGRHGRIAIRLESVSPSSPEHPAVRLDAKWADAAVRRAGPADPTKTYGLVVIEDDGTGIESESLYRIFEPFFSTKPREQGTGLGLAIVDSTILSLGGTYIVESRKGTGTRFLVYLPVHEPDAATAFASAAPSEQLLVD